MKNIMFNLIGSGSGTVLAFCKQRADKPSGMSTVNRAVGHAERRAAELQDKLSDKQLCSFSATACLSMRDSKPVCSMLGRLAYRSVLGSGSFIAC